ncbi:aminoglycoside phosphotransferase family protein [Actinoplanes sp. NPDC051633]|uniref:aminoglycoside phosphotransferase family protein n=1 Tax=Actinoplanes sp. NPDC051633 TaxID=3155670 RepID=UPI003413745D
MTAFVLPAILVNSVRADPAPGRHEWLSVLPDIVVDLTERWSLRLGRPYQPGGRCAWVASVRDVAGCDLVLKVAWRHDEATHEADGLRAWAGEGAVRVHDSAAFDSTSALLLERCHPGIALGQVLVGAHLIPRGWAQVIPQVVVLGV